MNYENQTVLCIGNRNNSCESLTIMLKQLGYRVVSCFTADGRINLRPKKKTQGNYAGQSA